MVHSRRNQRRASVLILLIAALGQGCASNPVPEGNFEVEIVSEPTGLMVAYREKAIGITPLSLRMTGLDETVWLDLAEPSDRVLERRIQVLGPNEVRVRFSLSDEPGPVAKALGLTDVVVFDYGNRASFELNKFDLKPQLEPMLNAQADLLKQRFRELNVYVCGHTDSSGGEDFNRTLSVKRAQAVADYLVAQGVSSEQLQVQGFGPDFPLAPNDDEAGRALNRRTEIILGDD